MKFFILLAAILSVSIAAPSVQAPNDLVGVLDSVISGLATGIFGTTTAIVAGYQTAVVILSGSLILPTDVNGDLVLDLATSISDLFDGTTAVTLHNLLDGTITKDQEILDVPGMILTVSDGVLLASPSTLNEFFENDVEALMDEGEFMWKIEEDSGEIGKK